MSSSANLAPDSPARFGAYLGMAIGGVFAFFGGAGLAASVSPSSVPELYASSHAYQFSLALLIGGVLDTLLCFLCLRKKRVAWSFALSLNGTGALVFLFGIPTVERAFSVGGMVAAIPCLLLSLTTVLLALDARSFES